MKIREALRSFERSHFKKRGGKAYRRLQLRRLYKFISFAESRGTFFIGQVGNTTFEAFFEANQTAEKTRQYYRQAWRLLINYSNFGKDPHQ